ncbi:hypothetical protein S40293_08128 [Stachybotrys chartarum IBT 40293]|nr:hypothetical protein S40293_08128 [Stachybotrys chartarum IBT 40293]
MPREAEPSLSERTFVSQALEEGLRIDSRSFEQYRPLTLTFGDEYGVAEVKLGKTSVLAKVSAEATVPYADRPFDGVFQISSELGPMVAPSFEVGRPTETEVLLSRLLEKTIRRSGALDTESLCLVAGKKCWSVRVDLHVLSHDGNLIDTCCFAVIAALRHFRKPDTSMDGEEVTIYTPAEREPVPLSWLHSPFCVTFNFFGDEGETVLLDATWLEEQLRVSSCTFSLNKHGEICQVSKLGGTAIDAMLFLQCAQTALSKSREFTDRVDRSLADDAKRRDKGGLLAELTAENDR